MINKDSSFADFVRFHPYTYARTHSTISAALMGGNNNFSYTQLAFAFVPQKGYYSIHDNTAAFFHFLP